ncbi:MAG: hypothetical protein ACTS4T_01785, partial [Candidatus Hodgkinia cicadicola]
NIALCSFRQLTKWTSWLTNLSFIEDSMGERDFPKTGFYIFPSSKLLTLNCSNLLQTSLSFVNLNFPRIDGIVLNYVASYSHELALRSALNVSFRPHLFGLLARSCLSNLRSRHLGNIPQHERITFDLSHFAFYETDLISLARLLICC